ncbi:MAG: tetratricopeptide repeat protein [Bacteroidaceae bacterium]|nr:tetratricopeptide repeat protein [Bacteroidaceae bacterium]
MRRRRKVIAVFSLLLALCWSGRSVAQINTERVLLMGRNALYYEDYVLAIQRFNMVINAKPWVGEPYFYRGLAKFYLEDYQGAEIDCSNALERNPYMANYYMLRALCRINQDRYQLAEEDYHKTLEINPMERNSWHNLVLCQMELKEYAQADSSLDQMIRYWPREASQYSLKAQVALAREDTTQALDWLDRALKLNPYEGPSLSMKAVVLGQRGYYQESEELLDRAIVQMPRSVGLYINRALARYNQDNLRGAMSDYDTALDIEPSSYLAHFNRGLLRAQVGEDNLGIEDFNYVLSVEPDNTIALYNRALLLDNVGDHNGAIRDISAVIKDYPDFWEGYRKRAEIRRKVGDSYGAERDEFKLMQARLAVSTGTYKSSGKTRKKSEHNIEEYDKLVEEDRQENENEYASEYRGRVQNHQTDLRVEPLYILTYYRRESDVKTYVAYSCQLEELNARHILPGHLWLTPNEGSMSEQNVQQHFDWITECSELLEKTPGNADLLLRRALDYYHVRDFENSIADLNALLNLDEGNVLALMLRAQSRYAQLEVSRTTASASDLRLGYLMVLQDYTHAAELYPDVAYIHYNKGNLHVQLGDYVSAIQAYTEALRLDSHFPDAYFSRGVAYLLSGQTAEALNDLSQAGEYGLYSAYSLIKKYSQMKGKGNNTSSEPSQGGETSPSSEPSP